MRILHVITRSEPGGAQGCVRALAHQQTVADHEVWVAAGAEGDGLAFADLPAAIRVIRLEHLGRSISALRDMRAIVELGDLYRSARSDIVHLHTSKAAALGRIAPGHPRRRIVYTMHGYDQLRTENKAFLRVDKAMRTLCGAIVAVSRFDELAMREDGYRVELIPNGVPPSRPWDPASVETLPERGRIGAASVMNRAMAMLMKLKKSGQPLIMLVARDSRPKRIDLARDVAASLRGRAFFAWAGGDPVFGDPENFVALGALPDAASLLPLADIFFLPSDHEGMPLSLLEAMAAGLPSVASAVGGIPEVLGLEGPGESTLGFAVENSAQAMAAAIEALVDDRTSRERKSKAAKDLWARRYSAARMALAYEGLYKKLL